MSETLLPCPIIWAAAKLPLILPLCCVVRFRLYHNIRIIRKILYSVQRFKGHDQHQLSVPPCSSLLNSLNPRSLQVIMPIPNHRSNDLQLLLPQEAIGDSIDFPERRHAVDMFSPQCPHLQVITNAHKCPKTNSPRSRAEATTTILHAEVTQKLCGSFAFMPG